MNPNRDIGPVLDAWLAEGATQVPDRVFDGAVARLRREPSRRAWHLPWRAFKVTMPIRFAGVGLAAIAILGVAFSVGNPINIALPSASPSPFPSRSATPPHTAAPSPAPIACVDGPCLGRLTPGSHTATGPLLPFGFSAHGGWVNRVNTTGAFMLEREPDFPGAAIYFWPDPVVADQSTCRNAPDAGHGRTADDIVGFLAEHPGLVTTEPMVVSLGGLPGWTLDVEKAPRRSEPCIGTVSLFVHSGTIEDAFWWDLDDARKMHIVVLEAGDGHTMLISVEARREDFDAFVQASSYIVSTFGLVSATAPTAAPGG